MNSVCIHHLSNIIPTEGPPVVLDLCKDKNPTLLEAPAGLTTCKPASLVSLPRPGPHMVNSPLGLMGATLVKHSSYYKGSIYPDTYLTLLMAAKHTRTQLTVPCDPHNHSLFKLQDKILVIEDNSRADVL